MAKIGRKDGAEAAALQPQHGSITEPQGLSSIELRILTCLLQGRQRGTIVDELRIGNSELQFQIRNILKKFSATNRAELMELVKAFAGVNGGARSMQ